jgi:cardiolipin synthase
MTRAEASEGEAHALRATFRDPSSFAVSSHDQSLTFYPAGADRRAALMELVDRAAHTLEVCFYIFAEDAVSAALRDRLAAAARRGVAVTLIIDRFGAEASDAFLQPLVAAGGCYLCFSPRWSQRYLIRNHQKMIIADGTRAMFGGFNIEDDYFTPPEAGGWTDLAVLIEGSAVEGLVQWFARLREWTLDERHHFRAIRRAVRTWDWHEGEGCRWLVGGPTRGLSTWARCVSRDLQRGEK